MADFKFRNAWSDAARDDERFRDPVAPLDRREASELPAIVAELLDQDVVEELPRVSANTWGHPNASGPRKVTAAVLAETLELREQGWSWPAIAKRFGVHRMALYHALRR